MATAHELGERLQAFFAAMLPLGESGGPGRVMLVPAALGVPLSPAEFTGSGTGTAGHAAALAHQRAAQLADQIPERHQLDKGSYVARAGSGTSRWYRALVDGSEVTSDDPAVARSFAVAKAEARKLLDGSVVGAVPGAGAVSVLGQYLATGMSPVDWFAADASTWSAYDVDAADHPPPAPASSPTPPPSMEILVVDSGTTDVAVVDFVQQAVEYTEPPVVLEPEPIDPTTVLVEPEVIDTGVVAEPFVTQPPVFEVLTANIVELQTLEQFPDQTIVTGFGGQSGPGGPVVVDGSGAVTAPDPAAVVAATTAVPTTSNGFSVSFEHCLVRFERPWWDDVFLARRGWGVPGFEPGSVSAGSIAEPSGHVTLLTIGMLVVRNLRIGAAWTDDDRKALQAGVSFGPFCIAGAGFDTASDSIVRQGLQVIGWLCQVPPVLPPHE